jgi:hypothetical protein
MKELNRGQTAHILYTEIYVLSGMDSDYAHVYHAVDDRFMTYWDFFDSLYYLGRRKLQWVYRTAPKDRSFN